MEQNIHRALVELSNNSPLTAQASVVLSKIEGEDLNILKTWLNHAVREQKIKIDNASKNNRYR